MKKVRSVTKNRDLKFLQAARARASTRSAVDKIDAEIAAYLSPVAVNERLAALDEIEKFSRELNKVFKKMKFQTKGR